MGDVGEMETRVCIKFPPMVNSCGLLGCQDSDGLHGLMRYSAPRIFLQMFFILVSSQLLHRLLKRLSLPALLSQVIVGLITGQLFFKSFIPEEVADSESLEDNIKVIGSLTSLGYMFFLFLNGVKVDPNVILRGGRRPLCIGVASVVGPIALNLGMTKLGGLSMGNVATNKTFFLAITYAMTSFPVTHGLVSDLKILNSELGRLAISAAIVSDMFSQFMMMISYFVELSMSGKPNVAIHIIKDVARNLAFVVGVLVVLRRILRWLLRRTTPEGTRVKEEILYLVIVLFLFSANLAAYFQTFILVGPFFLGLAIPEGPQLGSVLLDKFDSFVSGVLLPLFTTICASRVDLNFLFQKPDDHMRFHFLSAITIFLLKFGFTVLVPLFCKIPLRDSLALSFLLCAKGVVELATYTFMNETMLISQDVFGFNLVLMVITATTAPIILKFLYDPTQKYVGYEKRNIMHSSLNDELRMLVCIHVPSNVVSTINLLGNFYPHRGSGMTIDVLHLVKVCNQATPLFINHQKNRKVASKSYSENVVAAFDGFERDNDGVVNVNVFTAVSPTKLMHEDICNLAFDKLTSFIILPFHRRRLADGTIELDDSAIRNINCTVLERSPCSVGIFVEGKRHLKRSFFMRSSPSDQSRYKLAMIFLGGKDDREALTLASRLTHDMQVELTLVHLKAAYRFDSAMQKYDEKYDDDVLRNAKENLNVSFIEVEVNEGSETSMFLRSLVHKFDLIIVGRRYNVEDARTSGLDEWNEFPELGIVGDLLASKDFNGEYSIIVVQQQRTKNKRTKPRKGT